MKRHRAKTLSGLLTWLAVKVAYTYGQSFNFQFGRPLRRLAYFWI